VVEAKKEGRSGKREKGRKEEGKKEEAAAVLLRKPALCTALVTIVG
jgi:hypothetical protein